VQIIPIHFQKEIDSSDDISQLILDSFEIKDADILVVAQKIISKQEGQIIDLSTVTPSLLSQGIASQYEKDPRIIELILSESKRIVRMKNGIIIVETKHGFICANAGIDESNVKNGFATLLPVDSDVSAKLLCKKIKNVTDKNVAVVISDTFGRPFREGQTNHAIGVCGLKPLLDYAGTLDSFENILRVTEIAIADELSSAAELVMGKTLRCPVSVIRDYSFDFSDGAISELIRPDSKDLFK
jgi:coenzyme F420-0:L-glutamate ligase / coenzyme F420-1:gamma-L-glutamate ligase